MPKKLYKILSFVICFCFVFEQIGFAQVTTQLDIASHLAGLRSSFVQDKFRPLHLRYLAYDSLTNNFSLLLDKGSATAIENSDLEDTAQLLMKYFFVGLSLPNESFWVNLRPDAQDNIIDSSLEQTDVGRIMLEADVQLKKDTAKYTSPETTTGKEYWDKLYKKAGELFGYENITIPTLTRPWIVPGEIIVREAQDNAYIYKATLKVMLEQDYLQSPPSGVIARSPEGATKQSLYNFTDPRLKVLNEYSSQLIRELIIPKITQEVNTAKRYAPLRQVYYSLIFAQWFKGKFAGTQGQYAQLIDSRNLASLTSKEPWSKTTYFREYQKSFKDGEYNIKESASTPFGQTIRSYFSGGIAVTTETITAAKFSLPAGELVQGEQSSMREATSDGVRVVLKKDYSPKPRFGHSGNEVDNYFLQAQQDIQTGDIEGATIYAREAVRLLREVDFDASDDASGFPRADMVNEKEIAIWVLSRLQKNGTADKDFVELAKQLQAGMNGLELKQALGYQQPYPEKTGGTMRTEVAVQWLGERAAKGILNREVYEQLEETQPAVLRRIEKIVTQFPDSPSWSTLHDGEFGYNEEKRTVRIKLEKELNIGGEAVDEIHVQGVLFTREGYKRQDKYQYEREKDADKIRGLEFDSMGRVIETPFKFILMGAQPAYQVKQKYDNSLRMEAEGLMRAPIALGYLSYDAFHMDRNDEKLGVFIYAQRKHAPERALKLIRMPGAPVEKFFELYGRALRESYDFQEDPSLANVTLDISGDQQPIYHDLKEAKFRRDLTSLQAFAYRFDILASGFHRALEFMKYDNQQRVSIAIGFDAQMACRWFLKGFFYDRLEDKRFRIGLGRIAHSLEDADPNAELPNLIFRYMTLDNFGKIDLAVDEKTRQKPEDVIPMHWRSMVPFLSLVYDIEQTEYQYQPDYVNFAIAQAYQNLQSGTSVEEQSLEVLHQLLLLGQKEDLVNIDTAIDILKTANVPQYTGMIDFLQKNKGKKNLFEEIARNMPSLKIRPEDIRSILKRQGRKLNANELNGMHKPRLSLDDFKKQDEQKITKLVHYVESLKVGTEVWEQRLSPQFKMSMSLVQQTLKQLPLIVELSEKPGAWKRVDERSYTLEAATEGTPANLGVVINRKHDAKGRFAQEEGKSPEDMVRILSGSEHRNSSFTVNEYLRLWRKEYGTGLAESTAYSDLRGARDRGWVEPLGQEGGYRLTRDGRIAGALWGKLHQTERDLQALLVGVFQQLPRSGDVGKALQTAMVAKEEVILEKIVSIKQTRSEIALLTNSMDSYLGLNGTDSPDCGLCFRLVSILEDALSFTGYAFGITVVNLPESGQVVHKFIYVYLENRRIAIDMAAGQYIPALRGHVAVTEVDALEARLHEAFNVWWSEEENDKRLAVREAFRVTFENMRQAYIRKVLGNGAGDVAGGKATDRPLRDAAPTGGGTDASASSPITGQPISGFAKIILHIADEQDSKPKEVGRQEINRIMREVTQGGFNFNADVDTDGDEEREAKGKIFEFGAGRKPHRDISPVSGKFTGFIASDGITLVLKEKTNQFNRASLSVLEITEALRSANRRMLDEYIKIAKAFVECGFPSSFNLALASRHDINVIGQWCNVSVGKTIGNLASLALSKETATPPVGGGTGLPQGQPSGQGGDNSNGAGAMGGIDFRSLPIVTQAINNLSAGVGSIPLTRFNSVNLDLEWQQIEQLVSAGITPSGERIKEYLQASCYGGNITQDKQKIILCISDILRQEEERCCVTEPVLRDILVVLELSRSGEELKTIFLGAKP